MHKKQSGWVWHERLIGTVSRGYVTSHRLVLLLWITSFDSVSYSTSCDVGYVSVHIFSWIIRSSELLHYPETLTAKLN
ncbi:hypothetical protein BKA66DRAFT_65971 [Pyrenochaeta sp. MPI-SDFR-AT-0127]|nr:hypothetical protein BKA66DRAFT_65971 [Pyrenochaeta sp. MPI-SDFR-AT-0127]